MLKDTNTHAGDVIGIRVNFFYILYFFKLEFVGKHGRKHISKPSKSPFCFHGNEGHQKRHNEYHKC